MNLAYAPPILPYSNRCLGSTSFHGSSSFSRATVLTQKVLNNEKPATFGPFASAGFQVENRNVHRAGESGHPTVIARKRNRLALIAQIFA